MSPHAATREQTKNDSPLTLLAESGRMKNRATATIIQRAISSMVESPGLVLPDMGAAEAPTGYHYHH